MRLYSAHRRIRFPFYFGNAYTMWRIAELDFSIINVTNTCTINVWNLRQLKYNSCTKVSLDGTSNQSRLQNKIATSFTTASGYLRAARAAPSTPPERCERRRRDVSPIFAILPEWLTATFELRAPA